MKVQALQYNLFSVVFFHLVLSLLIWSLLFSGLDSHKSETSIKSQISFFLEKSCIDMNTDLSTNNEFKKDFFKFTNNSVFGKTIESD